MSGNIGLMQETLRGEIIRVIFETADGSYSIIRIKDDDGEDFVLSGPIESPGEGQTIEATGHWELHKEHGRRLRVDRYTYTLPATRNGLIRFLASGAVPGVGKTIAKKIVDHFGKDTIDVLNHWPKRLTEVEKIGRKKAAAIAQAWKESSARRESLIYLQGLGITPAYCARLFKRYGEACVEIIKGNPYKLAEEVNGIGFLKADVIARNMGIAPDSVYRMTAAAVFAVNSATQAGNTALPDEILVKKVIELTQCSEEAAIQGIAAAVAGKMLVRKDGLTYTPFMAFAERELPKEVARLLHTKDFAARKLRFAPHDAKLQLSDEQAAAVERLSESPLNILTGGPGVGKTTVIGEVCRRADTVHLRVVLAAPTGRAAKRLGECAGREAKTLHRLLQFDPATGHFVHDANTPLHCDLVIVDEVSMLDLSLALALFRAIPTGATLLLVGDADQLPSVGAGTVLADFLSSGLFLATHLTRIFRQGVGSLIVANAHRVNRGLMPELPAPAPGKLADFYWVEEEDPERIPPLIERLLAERIPLKFHLDPVSDCQVLSPMNKASCGTTELNTRIQQALNGDPVPEVRFGDRLFRLYDKVMQTSNNYDKNVFNGDMGQICGLSGKDKKLQVLFDDARRVEYDFAELEQLTVAYAITIHKSQGSEFPAVILPLTSQHYVMLQRNLLYTAMTRARKLLILIASRKAVGLAVRNTVQEPRYGNLRARLLELK